MTTTPTLRDAAQAITIITTPSGDYRWIAKDAAEVAHFSLPGQGHKIEVYTLAATADALAEPVAWINLDDHGPQPEVYVLTWDGKTVGIDWFGSLKRPRGTNYTHWAPFPAPPGAGAMYGLHSLRPSTPPTPQPPAEGMTIAGDGAAMLGRLMREQRASRLGVYPDGNPNVNVAHAQPGPFSMLDDLAAAIRAKGQQ